MDLLCDTEYDAALRIVRRMLCCSLTRCDGRHELCEDGRTYVQIASWPPAVARHGWRGWAWCVAAGVHETCTSRVIVSLVALEPDHGFTVHASVVELGKRRVCQGCAMEKYLTLLVAVALPLILL
jgi:hypothetical protein